MRAKPFFIHANPKKKETQAPISPVKRTHDKNDYFFKFLVLGNRKSGKSNLVLRYADDIYIEQPINTLGVDYKIKTIEINNESVKTQVWDYNYERGAGKFRGAHVLLITLDLADMNSLHQLNDWYTDVERQASEKVTVILVGTKCDVKSTAVTDSAIQAWMDAHPLVSGYIATSAKDAINVDLVFEKAAEVTIERMAQERSAQDKQNIQQKFRDLSTQNPQRYALAERLLAYINRIENYRSSPTDKINFASHFFLFKTSRATNREANYLLAKHLFDELIDTEKSILEVFANIEQTRTEVARKTSIFTALNCPNRGINSEELLNIIDDANEQRKPFVHLYNPFK